MVKKPSIDSQYIHYIWYKGGKGADSHSNYLIKLQQRTKIYDSHSSLGMWLRCITKTELDKKYPAGPTIFGGERKIFISPPRLLEKLFPKARKVKAGKITCLVFGPIYSLETQIVSYILELPVSYYWGCWYHKQCWSL